MEDKAISVKILKHRLYTRYMDNPKEFKELCELINNIHSDENTIRDMLCTLEKDGKIPHISFDTPIDEIMKMDFCSAVLGLLNMVIE